MEEALIPEEEASRLAELRSFEILDSPAEISYDDVSHLICNIAGTKIGIISLVDENRQWFKSCVGLDTDQGRETPRSVSFCAHTILQRQPLIIPDTLADPRFRDHPLVVGPPFLRFYAGFPLVSVNGFALGSLCAVDLCPRELADEQVVALTRLARQVMMQMELRRESLQLQRLRKHYEGVKENSIVLDPGASLIPLPRVGALEQLLSREQIIQMMDVIFGMETDACFTLLRCQFKEYGRVSATLGGRLAEHLIDEGARRLLNAIPPNASAARFSDSEFIVLLPHVADRDVATGMAQRLVDLVGQPFRIHEHKLPLTAAIGIALCNGNYDSSDVILTDASMALRIASFAAKSQFQFIDSETRRHAQESYELEGDVREAIQARNIAPFFQPLVDLVSGEPLGFEALARWQRGYDHFVAPSVFLPIANEAGITGELDLQVIEKALAAVPLLAREVPFRAMLLSVNLSAQLMDDPALRPRFLNLIRTNPMPKGWQLQVEVVEEAMQGSGAELEQFLYQLTEMNVRIAIDDFGTGYSSLGRLHTLPIHGFKIDRCFVDQIDDRSNPSNKLLKAMLVLANDLGLSTTAEGIEADAQRQWLLHQGFRHGQGFLLAKPMSLVDAAAYLHRLRLLPPAINRLDGQLDGRPPALRRGWRQRLKGLLR